MKIADSFKFILSCIGSLIFILFIIVMWSAQIKSCFHSKKTDNKSQSINEAAIIKASPNNLKHQKVTERLKKIYASFDPEYKKNLDIYFIADEKSLNAASFGEGRFIFWETIAKLPKEAVDCIVAHEIAHDVLLHSRKMRDADDLRNFFTEILSLLGGADRRTEQTLQEWSSKLTLPKYSKKQEYDADKYATEILSILGYKKPQLTYADTLKYIKDNYGDRGGGFFDSHPSTDERIQKLLSK